MTDSQSHDPNAPPPESLLAAVAREEGDPELFPDEVLRLHAEGHGGRARKALLEHAGNGRDPARAAKQLELAEQLRLWLEPLRKPPTMSTINGFGTSLHGRHQPGEDGTYIGTLWIVLLFLPVWPLRAYLVSLAEGGGWYFLARAPLPPFARRMRRVSRTVMIGLVGLLAWKVYWSGAHADLYVFNGFDRSVVAHVGAERSVVPPRRHATFSDLALGALSVGAGWVGDSARFESLSVDLTGHGRHTAIYNVADRAVLGVAYILYGEGTARDSRWLERGPVVFVDERIDYLFATPPDSKKVDEGSTLENSWLHAVDEDVAVADVALALFNAGRAEQALAVAKAELMVHPEDGRLAVLAARVLLRDDFDTQLALLRACLERAPDAVDVHRAYQDIWPADRRDAVRQEYASLLAAQPRSPMYHYLVGRLADDGSEAATSHFRAALALDPKYPPPYRALGYQAAMGGRWAEALAHYDRFASFGADEARETLDPRLRILRRLGRPRAEMERVITQTAAAHDDPLYFAMLGAHLRIEAHAGALAEETRLVLAVIRSKLGRESASPMARNMRADLAVTGGDLAGARSALREIALPQDRGAAVALRIALSDGGTQEDVALLREIPGWQTELGQPQRVMALPVVDADARRELIATLDPSLAPVVRLLDTPAELARPERLAREVATLPHVLRAAASFAAARALAGSRDAAAARRAYLAEARSFALPGELP